MDSKGIQLVIGVCSEFAVGLSAGNRDVMKGELMGKLGKLNLSAVGNTRLFGHRHLSCMSGVSTTHTLWCSTPLYISVQYWR